jgi:hypothetical protein
MISNPDCVSLFGSFFFFGISGLALVLPPKGFEGFSPIFSANRRKSLKSLRG